MATQEETQAEPRAGKQRPQETFNFLNAREAKEKFDLNWWQIYAAAKRGKLHPLQRNGAGRIYYPEWELEALAATLSCTYPTLVA